MKIFKLDYCALAFATISISFLLMPYTTHAALTAVDIDGNPTNGHEGVYDDVLDITWLANANLADSISFGITGISPTGSMKWSEAAAYIGAMNTANGGDGYLGVNTWRQPTVAPVSGSSTFNYGDTTYDGSTDHSYQLSAPINLNNPAGQSAGFTGSELAYHYYNNFEAIGECYGIGTTRTFPCKPSSEYGIDDAPDPNGYKSLFSNIVNHIYWTGTELDADRAFYFITFAGSQGAGPKGIDRSVWAVAPGNVAATTVPVPAAAWLFGTALWTLYRAKTRSNTQN